MVITLGPELEAALNQAANQRGIAPEALAIDVLRQQFLNGAPAVQARDEWERQLLGLGKDCGVTLTDTAVSSEGIYE